MIINGIEFEIIVNVKRIKRIYMRIKIIDNKYYFVINSYKRLSKKEIDDLIFRNEEGIKKLINKINVNNNSLDEKQFMIFGNTYSKEEINEKIIEDSYNEIIKLYNKYQIIFNRPNTNLKFRKMKSRWGVCNITKNYITLTKHLIHIPIPLIEYIIIHEFCHFKHPNHSKKFYDYVSKYCADYKKRVKELKKFSYVLK